MKHDPQKVLTIALAEVGYQEKETNAWLDHRTENAGDENYTKYARDLDKIHFFNGRKNGHAWCDVFVDWCFVQAYGHRQALKLTCQPELFLLNKGAGCRYSYGYYKEEDRIVSDPQPGDQIFFWNAEKTTICHTGLVTHRDDRYVHTVEGNTSGQTGVVDNGGSVCRKQYLLTDERIAGYGRPKYE